MLSEDEVIDSIRRFNRAYTKRVGLLSSRLLEHGFTLAEIRVLWEIAHKDHITAREIERELDMSAAVVSRMLSSLKRKGVARTEVYAHDRRIRNLRLTALGQRTIKVLESESSEQVAAMIGFVSNAGREKLVRSMGEIETLLDAPIERRWELVLRDPRPGDYGWVVQRHGALYAEEYAWDATFEALVAEIVAGFIRGLKPGRETCWIAERDGKRVGCVFLVEKSRGVGQLRLLLVEPEERGAGIGARLVRECIDQARSAGFAKLVLWTQSNLRAARRLYRDAGFELVKEEPHESWGARLTGEYWELDLRAPARSAARRTRRAR